MRDEWIFYVAGATWSCMQTTVVTSWGSSIYINTVAGPNLTGVSDPECTLCSGSLTCAFAKLGLSTVFVHPLCPHRAVATGAQYSWGAACGPQPSQPTTPHHQHSITACPPSLNRRFPPSLDRSPLARHPRTDPIQVVVSAENG